MGQVPVLGFDLLRRVPFWWSAPFCLLCVVHLQPADGPVQRPHPTPIRSGVLLDSVWRHSRKVQVQSAACRFLLSGSA